MQHLGDNTFFSCTSTLVDQKAMGLYSAQYLLPDDSDEYMEMYKDTQEKLKKALNSPDHEVYLLSGAASLGLWSAFNSVLLKSEKVIVIETGYYAQKISTILHRMGFDVEIIRFPHDNVVQSNLDKITEILRYVSPKMVVAVHCETGSGTVNDVASLGEICQSLGILLCVDFISSFGAIDIRMRDWNVDIGVFGTEKCLNLNPDLSIIALSKNAIKKVKEVKYFGYDGIETHCCELKQNRTPYGHNWRAINALNWKLTDLCENGIDKVFKNHQCVATGVRNLLKELGFKLYPISEEISSPCVTVAYCKPRIPWKTMTKHLEELGIIISPGLGDEKEKVFRIGHMGLQADWKSLEKALTHLKEIN